MHLKTFITLMVFVSLAISTQGQILNKLKKAAKGGVENAVERRVAHEIEKAAQKQTDKYLESLFGPPTQYEGGNYDYGEIMKSFNMNVDHADEYSFQGYTDMEISGTDEKGKAIDPTEFRSFSNPEAQTWAMELETDEKDLEKTIMIFDNNYDATVMLMEDKKGEKSRIAYGIDWDMLMDGAMSSDSVQQAMESLEIVKTGNTKSILGYTCDEYLVENDQYKANYWVSQSPIDGYSSYWTKDNFLFSKQMETKYKGYFEKLPDGDVLEISYKDKQNEETTFMKITDINTKDTYTFVMADYRGVMDEPE
jgi:hypothetical protein